jgi:Na+-driven multidrug efflux pump
VLIGKKIGEKDHAAARDYASRILRFAPLIAGAAALVLIPISWTIPLFFKVSREVASTAILMILAKACLYPCMAFNMSMIVGVGRAGGDTIFCGVYDVAFMWVVSLPAAAIAAYFFQAPFWLIYLLVLSEDPLKFFTGLWRYRSGKWLHDVTEGL